MVGEGFLDDVTYGMVLTRDSGCKVQKIVLVGVRDRRGEYAPVSLEQRALCMLITNIFQNCCLSVSLQHISKIPARKHLCSFKGIVCLKWVGAIVDEVFLVTCMLV